MGCSFCKCCQGAWHYRHLSHLSGDMKAEIEFCTINPIICMQPVCLVVLEAQRVEQLYL